MINKINFIYNTILDTQATIKAIDVKLGALIAGLLLPLSFLGRIWAHINNVSSSVSPFLGCTLGLVYFIVWFISIFLLIKTLSAIDNPTFHIKNDCQANGVFYSGGLYSLKVHDLFGKRKTLKSNINITDFISNYPENDSDIVKELSFEHMKLIYIRDIKLYRLKAALISIFIWVFIGFSIFIISKF